LRCQIKELEELVKIRDERKIVKKIQEIVPSFVPNFQYNE